MILSIDNVTVAHDGQPPIATNWSAALHPGVTWLYGDTGSGKSTLVSVMAGRMAPRHGDLTLMGVRLGGDGAAYRRNVFFIDAGDAACDAMTVGEFTAAQGDLDQGLWQALVNGFSLVPHLEKSFHMLSTGSRRKVVLAAALASRHPLVLLDEPTSGLDAPSVACLWSALAGVAARGGQAVVVASAERGTAVPVVAAIDLPLAR